MGAEGRLYLYSLAEHTKCTDVAGGNVAICKEFMSTSHFILILDNNISYNNNNNVNNNFNNKNNNNNDKNNNNNNAAAACDGDDMRR